MVDDAIYAWRTGYFEGTEVFQAADPGGSTSLSAKGARVVPHPRNEEAPAAAVDEGHVGERRSVRLKCGSIFPEAAVTSCVAANFAGSLSTPVTLVD
ncbi:hypothetical protein ACC740_33065 [Rhizobium ruizarguesonis]